MSCDRLNLTEYDFTVQDEGTIIILHPQNDAARSFLGDYLYDEDGNGPQWWGGGVVIDHRMAPAILDQVYADELTIGPRS